jgi:hypothetical protein
MTLPLLLIALCVAMFHSSRLFYWRRLARMERHRDRMGAFRTLLDQLVREGELDPASDRFRAVYRSATFVMRQPGRHLEAANAVLDAYATADNDRAPAVSLTAVERLVVVQFLTLLDEFCSDYLWTWWVVRVVDRRIRPAAAWISRLFNEPDLEQVEAVHLARRTLQSA